MALVQEGGGDDEGLTTGAKADFCLTAADTMLAGEKEKTPEEEEQLDGREVEEAMVGLDGTTGRSKEDKDRERYEKTLDLYRQHIIRELFLIVIISLRHLIHSILVTI